MAEKKGTVPPLQVHPLIRTVRWAALLSGVVFGIVQRRKYAELERIFRQEEERTRPAREAQIALEKRLRNEADMRELERIFLGTDSSSQSSDSSNETETVKEESTFNDDGNSILEENETVTEDGMIEKIVILPPDEENKNDSF